MSSPSNLPPVATVMSEMSTAASRLRAVQRVILFLRERFAEPVSLAEMARVAISSRFHFNRYFREITGLPPGRYLAALRLQAAKSLLMTTRQSVTQVCYAVGYNSLGTFTRHFTEFIGVSPNRLRRMRGDPPASTLRLREAALMGTRSLREGGVVAGRILSPDGLAVPTMVGLFRTPIPRGRPAACSLVQAPDTYRFTGIPNGRYWVFAVGLEQSPTMLTWFLGEMPVRGRAGPIHVRGNTATGEVDLQLRPPRLTDPPILVALPILLAEHTAAGRDRGVDPMEE